MKRFLKIALGLIATFIAASLMYDQINLWLIHKAPTESTGKLERLFAKNHDDEIMIFGSSRALGHFVPSIIGNNCFNYGISASGLAETMFLLEQAVQMKEEGVIIVNFDPWGFGGYGGKFKGDYRIAGINKHVRDILPNGQLNGFDWFYGVRFQGKLQENIAGLVNSLRPGTKQIDNGAVLKLISRTEKEWKIIESTLKPGYFNELNEMALKSLINIESVLARKKRLYVVWAVGPCVNAWRDHFQDEDKLHKCLSELKFRSPNYYVYDFYDDASFVKSDFEDPCHLNIEGAKLFSRKLVSKMKQDGIIE